MVGWQLCRLAGQLRVSGFIHKLWRKRLRVQGVGVPQLLMMCMSEGEKGELQG